MIKYLLILFLFACSPVRHWQKVATDTNVTPEKKAIIAPKVAAMFPAREIFIPGEVITKTDTVIDMDQVFQMAEIIDSLLYITIQDSTNRDSIAKVILKRFTPRTIRVMQTSVDTVQVPNSAREYSLMHDLEVSAVENAKVSAQLNHCKEKIKEWYQDQWFWIAVALFVTLAGSTWLHFKR